MLTNSDEKYTRGRSNRSTWAVSGKTTTTNNDEEYTRGRSDRSTGTVSRKKGDSVDSLYSIRAWIGSQ